MAQLDRALRIRDRFNEVFPDLAKTKDELHALLEEVEKSPDGSVDALRKEQFESVKKGANDLLLSLLFV